MIININNNADDSMEVGEMVFSVVGYEGGVIRVTADENMSLLDLAKILHEFAVDLGNGVIQRYEKAKDN